MASRRKRLLHEQTKPVDLYEAFDMASKITQEVPPTVPLPTGLSNEEDAQRHLDLRFNPLLKYCPNCETPVASGEMIYGPWCAYCGDALRDMGTAPRKKKLPQQ